MKARGNIFAESDKRRPWRNDEAEITVAQGRSAGLLKATMRPHTLAFLLIGLAAAAAETPMETKGSFLVDPVAVGKTPKHLGVCLEVAEDADRSNLWDWLADSGAKMARVIHPDNDLRSPAGKLENFKHIKDQAGFEAYRAHLLADPAKNLPWSHYLFDQRIAWLGVPDDEVRKAVECGVAPVVSMAYSPRYYPRSLLKAFKPTLKPADEAINWDAAASAYEYYFANIQRFATRHGVTHYMMLNEPDDRDLRIVQQTGVLARFARLAMEDVRAKLTDPKVAQGLRLSAPACHFAWESYWPYVEPYCDSVDFHFYSPDPDMFRRQHARLAIRARASGKKTAITEFNRIGGPLQPDQALFSLKPSLQFAGVVMSVLSANQPQDPGCEMALAYEFQFPATHRSGKSLAYGDMNRVDWTGQDKALNHQPAEAYPTFAQFQLRMATPAYHMFRMLARCTPGAGDIEAFEVLGLGESTKGLNEIFDQTNKANHYRPLNGEKYYALGGAGPDLRTLAVRTPDRLYVTILNPGPAVVKRVGFNLELLGEKYATAVVRETSHWNRDKAVRQASLKGTEFVTDLPAESLTQIIFTKVDLGQIKELKTEEKTFTPGKTGGLAVLETTRLRALGKLGDTWIDLTDLNVEWTSSEPDLVTIYQGGLVQRLQSSAKEVTLTAKTLSGAAATPVVVAPSPGK